MNSSSIRLTLDYLGGYLPVGALGPSTVSSLISKMNKMGPTPLITIYYDLSYNQPPTIILIIDGPTESAPVLEHSIRWKWPTAPPYRIREEIPPQLNELLDAFLPSGLGTDQKNIEKASIIRFIQDLNQVSFNYFWECISLNKMRFQLRRDILRRDFSESFVINNVTTLAQAYTFVSNCFTNAKKLNLFCFHI